ncbi:MAG: sugar nucleotide-binding protein [Geminicoccaceae bacterium]|nr:sugar nucleotide-binding protein [Geminicoccaceae bacterium]
MTRMVRNDVTALVIGSKGMIGQALVATGLAGCSHAALRDGMDIPSSLRTLVHAGRDPRLGTSDYDIDNDIENVAARIAVERDLHYIMLSSRKVYGDARSPITEETPLRPTDLYGRQKLAMEERLRERLGSRLTILRISNVFSLEPGRRSFFGMMLDRLAGEGEIRFDMSPLTARDFIPLELAADIIAAIVAAPPGGVVNIGSGVPLPTGDLARAVIDGFGSGRLVSTDLTIRDAFVLDVASMYALTGLRVTRQQILNHARHIGERLRADRLPAD